MIQQVIHYVYKYAVVPRLLLGQVITTLLPRSFELTQL